METFTFTDDPLTQEIAAFETAIIHDTAEITELEGLLVQKKQKMQMLLVEMRALKRAAVLRPVPVVNESIPEPKPRAVGLRGVVAPSRGGDSRIAAKASESIFGIRQKTAESSFM